MDIEPFFKIADDNLKCNTVYPVFKDAFLSINLNRIYWQMQGNCRFIFIFPFVSSCADSASIQGFLRVVMKQKDNIYPYFQNRLTAF